ncbi:MAG: type II toxin-antitoxin system VapC family toxin [Candidatus Sumerlaeaceae bacterium]
MKYLVDTNVLSEAMKPLPNTGVIQWLRAHEQELTVNPIVLGEIRTGISMLPAGRKRRDLEQWFGRGVASIACLAMDAQTGLLWAALVVRLRHKGTSMPLKDSLIAASALQHGLTMVTRNMEDFKTSGVKVLNPFS